MASSSSYPPNESHSTIIREKTWFQGMLLSNFFFGIETTLCALGFLAVFRKRSPTHGRVQITLLVYIAMLFAIGTAVQGLTIDWIQAAFTTERNYPGGPSAYLNNEWSIPVSIASNILSVIANWMMESLLVWRCRVVCSTGGRLWGLGVAIPMFLLICVIAAGSFYIYENVHAALTTTCIITYSTSSLALNLTATAFIAGRLLVCRHRVVKQLGRGHGRQYVGISAVMVESAALYTCFLLVIISAYATGSVAEELLQLVILQVQTIASLLIIWRIARGEGWTKSTPTEMMSTLGSSLNTRVGPGSQQNVLQLEVISVQPGGEAGMRKEGGSKVSILKHEDV